MERVSSMCKKYYRIGLILLVALSFCFSCSKGSNDKATDKMLPAFKLITQEKKELKTKDFRKGIYILSVLTDWCNPCQNEIEKLKELKSKYNSKVSILLATSDSLEWTFEDTLHLPWAFASPEFFEVMRIKAIPTRILIKDGKELFRIEGIGPVECEMFEDSLSSIMPD